MMSADANQDEPTAASEETAAIPDAATTRPTDLAWSTEPENLTWPAVAGNGAYARRRGIRAFLHRFGPTLAITLPMVAIVVLLAALFVAEHGVDAQKPAAARPTTSVTPAPTVTATAGPSADDIFRGALKRADIGYANFWEAIDSAHAVCISLESGQSPQSVVEHVASSPSNEWSRDTIVDFVMASQEAYCPRRE